MPPERLPWDRKEFFKDRKPDRSTPRWRESSSSHYGSSRDFSRWGGSNEFRRPPGHGKQGGWHLFAEESSRGYAPFRSNDRILEDKNYRPSVSRGDGKYGRNSRDNRGSFSSQRDWKAHSWEMSNGSPSTPGRLHDAANDQRSVDDMLTYPPSHSRSELGNKWEHLHPKDQHDNIKAAGVSAVGTGQRGDRESSLDWKPLKWDRSGSLSSRGSGFSHSSSSKSIGGGDSSEGKADMQLKSASIVQSPSGDAAACVTSAPSEDMSSRKKPRLNWGEGLAKYEKKKVEGPEMNVIKDEPVIYCINIEPIHSQSSNLVDKSPRVLGLSDCASPATPSSVACSSPGVEEKTLGKGVNVDNDVGNLCGSPSFGSQTNNEGLSFNLEVLDATSISNLGASLVELLQSDDSSSVDSSFVRSTLINKLHMLKGDISKALEVTESEIDSLESELKLLKFEPGSMYPGPAASSFFQAVNDAKPCSEQGAVSNDIPRSSPLHVMASGSGQVENSSLDDGVLEEVNVAIKDDDVDSPGTATSKFVEPLSVVKMVSSSDMVKLDHCSGDIGVLRIQTMALKPCVPYTNKEDDNCAACGDVSMLIESKDVVPFPSDVSFAEDNLCNLILAANKESANRASEELSTLLPRDQCKVDVSEVSNAALWKADALIKEKFAMRKRFLRFKDRVVTLKFKAFQHLWKEDMRLLSVRKYRAKSQKKYELSLRTTHSGCQKNRSSIRTRFSSPVGNLSLVPTTEMLNFTSKLLSVSQNKLYRNALKMPALILDKKERMVSRFVSSNGLVEDPCAVEKERAMINPWTLEEREIFISKLTTIGKDFRKIASFLDHKTTADCVEFYYKNHKSDCFEKTKKSKKVKSSTNYLMSSGKNWNREMNAASLDILGAASVIAADADNSMGNRQMCSGRIYYGGYCESKIPHGNDGNLDRSSNFDVLENERETAAADVLAGICGSMSSEAMSSCITTSVDPGEGCREWKSQKVDSVKKRPSTSDVTQNVDEDTSSDESCGEMDPSDWTDEEKSIFIRAVSSYGKDFAMISRCVRTRSRDQCKVFFSKARKCLGLDSIHPAPGNLGTPVSDDANGGGSDTEDGCALETGSVICSDKLGSKTDEDLPLPVIDAKHEKSNAAERENVTADLNNPKESNVARSLEQNDSKDEISFVSDACKMGDKSELAFEIDTHQSEVGQAQEISNESVNSESKRDKPIEHSTSVGEPMYVDAADPGPLNPVSGIELKVIAEVAANGSANHVEQKEVLLPENSLNSKSGLMKGSSANRDASCLPLDMGSSSNFSVNVENIHHVSGEFDSVAESPTVSLPQENNIASGAPMLQDTVSIQCERMHTHENRDGQGKESGSGDDHLQHPPGKSLVNCSESLQILRGYPLQIPTKKEMNGDISCGLLSEVQKSFSTSDYYLQKCNSSSKTQSSLPELPLLSKHAEHGNDHSRDHSRSLSDTEKPCRNGDVKLFGKILSNPSSLQKMSPSVHDNVEHGPKASSKSSTLKFTGHQTTDGSSNVLKFDRSNYLGLENVPVKSYGFWDGNKIQTGFSSLPEYFLAKYPAAFSNYHVSSSKMEQQALQAAVKCNDRNLNGVSVLPPREVSGSNGVVDYQMYKSHDNSKVQPFSVDMKQRQDIFSEIQRRNGFEAISSLQQQGRGVVGMNVVGRAGILVGGSCTGVSDPVAALKMHYAKTEQFSGQNGAAIIREEESWRSKGDIGR
ncbi:hypothetical protein JCGZ_23950 [Jatropha curcas]|uniref:SANT domain-containing protein n=1 Tax=Jatropha curcas TaxID=180498 RepID=A0A067K1T6_JATCU|nr:uncharacterized protein LOC105645502 isoform X2 [Jatropha curcas]KDP25729.1 hypothetical protein JCGZ_23950 [Jatropha curcas]